jgi:hypothetical protein
MQRLLVGELMLLSASKLRRRFTDVREIYLKRIFEGRVAQMQHLLVGELMLLKEGEALFSLNSAVVLITCYRLVRVKRVNL